MTMSPAELALLHARLDAASSFLEFGAGASTIAAAIRSSLARIDSVESSAAFIDQHVRPAPAVQAALSGGRLHFHIIDIGPTGDWGAPIDNRARHLWPNYPLSVFARPSTHDLVLIDGRFRVACTLAAILSTPPTCTIAIHDFWNRPHYHRVLPFLNVIARADTLAVFSKRTDIHPPRLRALLRRFQYLPNDTPPNPLAALKRRLTRQP